MTRGLILFLALACAVEGKVVVYEGTGDACSTLLYAEVFSVKLSEDETVDLTEVTAPTASCSVTDNDGRAMEISFGDLDSVKAFKVGLTFSRTATGYYKSGDMTVSYTDNTDDQLTLSSKFKHVPLIGTSFSFACSLKSATTVSTLKKIVGDEKTTQATVTLDKYQLQVYNVKEMKFSTEIQCVNWISKGAWMGVFAGVLTITVLIMSVLMLLGTATPDRFETSKSKGLIIPHEH